MVWPMNVGKITDARDQVLTTFFSLRLFISSMTEEAGLDERALLDGTGHLLYLPAYADAAADDEASGGLRPPGAIAHRGLAHGVLGGMPVGDLPSPPPCGWSRGFMTTPRTSDRWPMPGAPGLAEVLVLVVEVADLADRGHAAHQDAAHLAGRHADRDP